MNRTQQSAGIAICLLGLAVLAVGGVFLVREWRAEVAARKSLEQENARLRVQIEEIKQKEADLSRTRALLRWSPKPRLTEEERKALKQAVEQAAASTPRLTEKVRTALEQAAASTAAPSESAQATGAGPPLKR